MGQISMFTQGADGRELAKTKFIYFDGRSVYKAELTTMHQTPLKTYLHDMCSMGSVFGYAINH